METYDTFDPKLQSHWDRLWQMSLLKVPFTTFLWHKMYTEIFPQDGQPLIFFDPNLNLLGSFLVKNGEISFGGGTEIADYLDVIGQQENTEVFWNQLLEELKQRNIKTLVLSNLPAASTSLEYFQNNSFKKMMIQEEDTTPFITLPESWENYLGKLSHKNRHETERKMRKFERDYPTVTVQESIGPKQDMSQLITLMRMNPRKELFMTPAMEQFFLALPEIAGDSLKVTTLYVNEMTVAAIVGFVYSGTYYLYNSGSDIESVNGAGFYLYIQSIKRAIEKKLKIYNFLQGNERYKYELGGVDSPVYTITLTLEE